MADLRPFRPERIRASLLHMPTDPIDLAYLAGIVDGEGSINMMRNHPVRGTRNMVRVSIANTDKALMTWLREIGGGVITDRKNGPGRECFTWQIMARADVIHFLDVLIPYLRIKRVKAEEVIAYARERMEVAA